MRSIRMTTRPEIPSTTRYCVLCQRPGHHIDGHAAAAADAPPDRIALARLQVAMQEMVDMGASNRMMWPLHEAILDIWGRVDEPSIFEEAASTGGTNG